MPTLSLSYGVCTYMAACVHSYYCSTLLRQHHECSKLICALLACLLFTLIVKNLESLTLRLQVARYFYKGMLFHLKLVLYILTLHV